MNTDDFANTRLAMFERALDGWASKECGCVYAGDDDPKTISEAIEQALKGFEKNLKNCIEKNKEKPSEYWQKRIDALRYNIRKWESEEK